MKWNGTVSHSPKTSIAARFAIANATHATSIQCMRSGHSRRSSRIDSIPLAAYGRDGLRPELCAQPANIDVHHVGSGIEVVPPHRGEQAFLGYGPPGPLHQFLQEQELTVRERDGPGADIGPAPHEVQCDSTRGEDGRAGPVHST